MVDSSSRRERLERKIGREGGREREGGRGREGGKEREGGRGRGRERGREIEEESIEGVTLKYAMYTCKYTTTIKTHLKFDSTIRILPVVTMLHPLKRSMVLSSIISLASRPSHSEK